MFRSLRKAAESLETAFSSPASAHAGYVNRTLRIANMSIRLGPVIAEGGFSFVHRAKPVEHAGRNIRYAVKRLSCPDGDAHRLAIAEMRCLEALPPHRNVVRFHGGLVQGDDVFLMFEMVDGGSLPEVLARKPNGLVSGPKEALAIFADAVAAVAHLHAQDPPVAIRDVKLENLLYDRLDGCYKLCDLGSATTIAKRHVSRRDILAAEDDIASHCSAMYRAPEQVDLYRKQFLCEAVDVWALGCVWHAILFGSLPFDGQSSLPVLQGLRNVPSEPAYPPPFTRLLYAMLTVDPAERPNVFTVLEAVRRLQGAQMDPQLRSIGAKLRARRALDFAHQPQPSSEVQPVQHTVQPTSSEPAAPSGANQENEGDLLSFGDSPYKSQSATAAVPPHVQSQSAATIGKSVLPGHSSPALQSSGSGAEGSRNTKSTRRKEEPNLFWADEPPVTRALPLPKATPPPKPPAPAFFSTGPVPGTKKGTSGAAHDDDWTDFKAAFGGKEAMPASGPGRPGVSVPAGLWTGASSTSSTLGGGKAALLPPVQQALSSGGVSAPLASAPAISADSSRSWASSSQTDTNVSASASANTSRDAVADFSDLIDALPDGFGTRK